MFCNELKELKDSIVSKHNELRAKVANGQEEQGVDGAQPKAANMMELVWSDELAEVAQRYHLMNRITCFIIYFFQLYIHVEILISYACNYKDGLTNVLVLMTITDEQRNFQA